MDANRVTGDTVVRLLEEGRETWRGRLEDFEAVSAEALNVSPTDLRIALVTDGFLQINDCLRLAIAPPRFRVQALPCPGVSFEACAGLNSPTSTTTDCGRSAISFAAGVAMRHGVPVSVLGPDGEYRYLFSPVPLSLAMQTLMDLQGTPITTA